MPELPEVETTRLGLLEHSQCAVIEKIIVRNRRLRYPIAPNFEQICKNQKIKSLNRRSKYLIFQLENGYILLHLGMSGHLRILPQNTSVEKHDHVDILLNNNQLIRYTDPRRFGMINHFKIDQQDHPLLCKLGPEPLTNSFNSKYLYTKCQSKKKDIKKLIMDSHIIVGVGNIYAQECLFLEKISPKRRCDQLTLDDCQNLVKRIKKVLKKSIQLGGTTLKDFKQVNGKPGYFAQTLNVYGRYGKPCISCDSILEKCIIESRTTTYCPNCQK